MAGKTLPLSVVAASAVGGSAVVLVRRLRQQPDTGPDTEPSEARSRWRAVTINRDPDEVMRDGRVPEPLAELGDLVEVEVAAAPGGRGSELRARLRRPEPTGIAGAASRLTGHDPRQQVRSALREAKQLIEVGEVLRVDPAPHGRRSATPTSAVVDLATKRAAGEGVL